MNNKNYTYVVSLFFVMMVSVMMKAQSTALRDEIKLYLDSIPEEGMDIGEYRVKKIWRSDAKKVLKVTVTGMFGGMPFRLDNVKEIQIDLAKIISQEYPDYRVEVYVNDDNIADLVPYYYSQRGDMNRVFQGERVRARANVVRRVSDTVVYGKRGLAGRNLALWHSHGKYYKQQEDRWVWQRARLFTTVEDKFSPSFVIPYLLPMLENAGANVFLPRERDVQKQEVIVDNDTSSGGSTYGEYYVAPYEMDTCEKGATKKEEGTRAEGFAARKEIYKDWDNPFREGTYKYIETSCRGSNVVVWTPDIPQTGDYSVWVAYKSVEGSISDAKYTVYHAGGETKFAVNQRMGGGTWIYLGTFHFKKGLNSWIGRVELTNKSEEDGFVTADAVRFGGGMGNIARTLSDDADLQRYKAKYPDKNKTKLITPYNKEKYEVSRVSRFNEGSRYWMQWAGVPDSIYSLMMGLNDYTDDYGGRGPWVNWLNYGSKYAPDSDGLGIPIDVSLAFHTDAGVKKDGVVGTLGIYRTMLSTECKTDTFPLGVSRYASRDLTDMVISTICDDISRTVNPNWVRRGMWDRGYSECRRPEVPSMILELMSHQNVEDMRFGLDPRFKFIVSRAVYKGVLKYIYSTYDLGEPMIQPLPVKNFAAELVGRDSVKLIWQPRVDSLDPHSNVEYYVVYTNTIGGWDNGRQFVGCEVTIPVEKDVMHSYKVVAVNQGGKSMDSEVLSVCSRAESKGTVMIINGFDRVAAPQPYYGDSLTAGFSSMRDMGVPHKYDLQYCGAQYEYDIRESWVSDDAPGWGASHSQYDDAIIAGNTFDYPIIHGAVFHGLGYSYCSSSRGAVEEKMVNLNNYDMIDVILGEQQHIDEVDSVYKEDYTPLTDSMQTVLQTYVDSGMPLFVSGAYIASGMKDDTEERAFIREVLKVDYSTEKGSQCGKIKAVYAPNINMQGEYEYSNTLNDSIYMVESPDALLSVDKGAYIFMRYADNNKGAAVAYDGAYRVVTSAIPFETILTYKQRKAYMRQVVEFLMGER